MGSWHEDGHQEQPVPGPAREKALRAALLLACTHALASGLAAMAGMSLGLGRWPRGSLLEMLGAFVLAPPIGLIPGLPLCVLGWAVYRHVSRAAWLAYALVSQVIVAGAVGTIWFTWSPYVASP